MVGLEKAMILKNQLMIFFDLVKFLILNGIAISQSDENLNPISFLKTLLVIIIQ